MYVPLCMRAVMQFPPEEVRRALGERIGLTEQQVQVILRGNLQRDMKRATL